MVKKAERNTNHWPVDGIGPVFLLQTRLTVQGYSLPGGHSERLLLDPERILSNQTDNILQITVHRVIAMKFDHVTFFANEDAEGRQDQTRTEHQTGHRNDLLDSCPGELDKLLRKFYGVVFLCVNLVCKIFLYQSSAPHTPRYPTRCPVAQLQSPGLRRIQDVERVTVGRQAH